MIVSALREWFRWVMKYHVDGSSASHAVQLLHRSLLAQSSCLSLHPVIVPTSGSFHQTQSSNPQTSKSLTVLKVLPSVNFSNNFASLITVYMMFSVFLNWGGGGVKNCCFKHCSTFLWCLLHFYYGCFVSSWNPTGISYWKYILILITVLLALSNEKHWYIMTYARSDDWKFCQTTQHVPPRHFACGWNQIWLSKCVLFLIQTADTVQKPDDPVYKVVQIWPGLICV